MGIMKQLLTYLNEERGRRHKLASALGISPSAISMWDGDVPLKRLSEVSKITGIAMQDLRPDFFEKAASV